MTLLVLAIMAAGSLAALSLGGGGGGPAVTVPAQSGSGSGSQLSAGGVVDQAADIAAEQNLDTALDVVQQAALSSSYGRLSVGTLEGADRQLAFTSGASSDDDQASLAISASPGSGSVTLAMRSESGTCFFAWTTTGSTWFGTEPDAPSCAATALGAPPAPSDPGPGRVGWQQGSFPPGSG